MVLRVTSGIIGAPASLAPEPTVIVAPAPPFDPDGAVAGRPAMLPGCTLDIPPEPAMTNDQTEALSSTAQACGCADCQCGDDCACAQPGIAQSKACEDAGCGCGA